MMIPFVNFLHCSKDGGKGGKVTTGMRNFFPRRLVETS
jgi:hypothetical protein